MALKTCLHIFWNSTAQHSTAQHSSRILTSRGIRANFSHPGAGWPSMQAGTCLQRRICCWTGNSLTKSSGMTVFTPKVSTDALTQGSLLRSTTIFFHGLQVSCMYVMSCLACNLAKLHARQASNRLLLVTRCSTKHTLLQADAMTSLI